MTDAVPADSPVPADDDEEEDTTRRATVLEEHDLTGADTDRIKIRWDDTGEIEETTRGDCRLVQDADTASDFLPRHSLKNMHLGGSLALRPPRYHLR